MLPVAANEWLKGYIKQLIDLDMIEPCSGPWAAAVVLVPNDKDKQKPRRRYRRLKKVPRIKISPTDKKPQSVWSILMIVQGQEEAEPEFSTLETMQYNYGVPKDLVVVEPPQLAGKKDPYRLCLNYRPINLAVLDTGYPIPNINFLFTLLAGAQYYSVFDCLKGFWQMELDEESRDYTGFTTTFGQYRWKRLPMGLKVSPQAWQSSVDSIFINELYKFFLIYIDDGLVFSQTFEEHLKQLDVILGKAKAANLSLSVTKCRFGYQEVKLLGHIVGQDGFKMDPSKVERIVNWPRPQNTTDVNQFVGMIQYYRRYLRGLSTILAPLNQLKKKNVAFIWDTAQEEAFQECKSLLMSNHVLKHPDFTKPFILFTDASNIGIGAVLSQQDDSEEGFIRPVYYGSKSLTDAERRTSIYEREFLAIVYFIHFFKVYLIGHKFVVYTDQKSLQYLIKFNEEASAKVVRWQASLLAYDFDIIYRPGKLNANADALSRLDPVYSQGPDLEEIIEDYYIPLNMVKRVREDEADLNVKKYKDVQDQRYGESDGMSTNLYYNIIQYLSLWQLPEGASDQERKAIKGMALKYEVSEGRLYTKSTKKSPRRKVVKDVDVLLVLKAHHDHLLAGHQGVTRTFNAIKDKYYWPGYFDTVRRYVSSCNLCQNFGPRNPPTPLTINPKFNSEGPFSNVVIDYIYLPLTARGNNSALVMVDKFTGWVECVPTPTQSAGCTCIALFEWICRFGKMNQIECDNGSHFNAEEVKVLMISSYGIDIHFGVPYHPQGQGKVERMNGAIKAIMKKYAMTYVEEWDMWLPAILYVIRTSPRQDHGYSSFYLAYGRQPRQIEEDAEELQIDGMEITQTIMQRVQQIVELNRTVIPLAKSNIIKYKMKMIERYNRTTKTQTYNINDLVMVLEHAHQLKSAALVNKWVGPFRVESIVGHDIYRVKDGELKLPIAYHANQMKLYKARPRLSANLKYYSRKQDLK